MCIVLSNYLPTLLQIFDIGGPLSPHLMYVYGLLWNSLRTVKVLVTNPHSHVWMTTMYCIKVVTLLKLFNITVLLQNCNKFHLKNSLLKNWLNFSKNLNWLLEISIFQDQVFNFVSSLSSIILKFFFYLNWVLLLSSISLENLQIQCYWMCTLLLTYIVCRVSAKH